MSVKEFMFVYLPGCILGVLYSFVGEWSALVTTLLIFMALDYVSGVIVAAILKKSNKTESGGLSSKVGLIGILKKCLCFLLIIIGYRLDLLLSTNYIRDCVCVAILLNECVSITENMGLAGIPLPAAIVNALDQLRDKNG